MYIKQSYDDDFQHLLLDLKDKYPSKIFQLEGISDEHLDIVKYSKNYFNNRKENKAVADNTIDPNANVQIRNIATYQTESVKGIEKLNSLYLLWSNAKKLYGTKEANSLIEKEVNKEINIQDCIWSYKPYCFAFDTHDILEKGLPFVTNYPSVPAKHSDVFLQHVIQLLQYAAPQLAGATAIPNFLVIYSALLKEDSENPDYPVPDYRTNKELFDRYFEQ